MHPCMYRIMEYTTRDFIKHQDGLLCCLDHPDVNLKPQYQRDFNLYQKIGETEIEGLR